MEDYRKVLVNISKKAEKEGLCIAKSGNFSIFDRKKQVVFVTPSQIPREELLEEHICLVDLDGNIIEAKEGVKPTSELFMHLELYKNRSDINSVCHTHSTFATSFAIAERLIPKVVDEMENILGNSTYVPVTKYYNHGTKELAMEVSKALKSSDSCLIAKHGAVTVSNISLEDAYVKSLYLEEVAKMYYYSLHINNLIEL